MRPAVLARTRSAMLVVLATLAGGRGTPEADGIVSRTLDVGGRPLHLLAAGDACGTPVLLLHGTPGSAEGWSDYLAAPPAATALLAIDRPGFGASGGDAVISLAMQAEAALAALPPGRRAVLLGHSLGGAVAAQLAADHPGRIAALVLLAAALDPELERVHPLQPIGAWAPVRAMLPRSIRNANAELLALRAELLALQPRLARITAPVLIVHGGADTLVPVENVPYMQRHLNGTAVQTRVLAGRNHFLPWNAAQEVHDAIAWGVATAVQGGS